MLGFSSPAGKLAFDTDGVVDGSFLSEKMAATFSLKNVGILNWGVFDIATFWEACFSKNENTGLV